VQWENKCSYETATVAEFRDWLTDSCKPDNAFLTYDRSSHWCYADYKYMAKLFATKPDVLKVFTLNAVILQMFTSCTELPWTCGWYLVYLVPCD